MPIPTLVEPQDKVISVVVFDEQGQKAEGQNVALKTKQGKTSVFREGKEVASYYDDTAPQFAAMKTNIDPKLLLWGGAAAAGVLAIVLLTTKKKKRKR